METFVTCMECGKRFKQLCTHLPVHNLTVSEYKKKYPGAPTISEETSEKIKEKRKEQAPRFGIPCLETTKEKIRKTTTGKKYSVERLISIRKKRSNPEWRREFSRNVTKGMKPGILKKNNIRLQKFYGFTNGVNFIPVTIEEIEFVHSYLYKEQGGNMNSLLTLSGMVERQDWQRAPEKDLDIHVDDWGICPYCKGIVKLLPGVDVYNGKTIGAGKLYCGYYYHAVCLEKIFDRIIQEKSVKESPPYLIS